MCSIILTFFQQTFLSPPSVCPLKVEASNTGLSPIWPKKVPRKLQSRFELTLSCHLEFQQSLDAVPQLQVQVYNLLSSQLHQPLLLHCFPFSHIYPYLSTRIKSTILIHCHLPLLRPCPLP